jgi:peptide-methionine (S)-S-oxide reductase
MGDTNHAESVEIAYDPRRVSLGTLLSVYFSVAHDPTQRNRQGPDTGTQYRSAIFVSDAAQAKIAREYIAQLEASKVFAKPIVTRIEPLSRFYPAEAYHQDYLIRHPDAPYIVINDLPKIENLKSAYPMLWRDAPAVGAEEGAPVMRQMVPAR